MISQEHLKEIFLYKDGRLFWNKKVSDKIVIGKRAGTMKKGGYRNIKYNKKLYLEHRLIFCMFHGYYPELIDHISDVLTEEGIKSNKIENLQHANKAVNQHKSKERKHSSKYRGVSYCKREKKYRACATIKQKYVSLGYYEKEEDARDAYLLKTNDIYKNFN